MASSNDGGAVAPPVKLKQAFSMLSVGVSPASLTSATATLSSDRYIVVREAAPKPALVVLDTSAPERPVRRPIVAEAALMNPSRPVLALRSPAGLQLFHWTRKATLARSPPLAEPVVFWAWINSDVLALVTATSVFHWTAPPDDAADAGSGSAGQATPPEMVFDRHATLAGCQIVSYKADPSLTWLAIVGLSPAPSGQGVAGRIQLFSTTKQLSQVLDGHSVAFAAVPIEGVKSTLFLFAASPKPAGAAGAEGVPPKLHVVEVGAETKPAGSPPFEKVASEIFHPPEMAGDFPIGLHVSVKYPTVVHLVTRGGYAHVYELTTGACVYMNRISTTTPFASTPHRASGGIMALNRAGDVLLFAVAPDAIIRYVLRTLRDPPLGALLASRNGFGGADNFFVDKFEDAMDDGDWREAAIIASESPGGVLRSADTIMRFRRAEADDEEGVPPILIYFQTLLSRGALNADETVALTEQLASTGKLGLLEKWLREDKLACTETLGDALRPTSASLALGVYIKCGAHAKVISCMVEAGQASKVAHYAKKVGMRVTAMELAEMTAAIDPKAALEVANSSASNALVLAEGVKKKVDVVEVNNMVNMFLNRGMLQEAVSYALDALKDEDEAECKVQTKVLATCLTNAPQLADAILSQDVWHKFETGRIGILCERAGLFQHALELFTDLADVKRVITNTHVLNGEFIVHYFATIAEGDRAEVMQELLRADARGNLRLCVTIAAKYTESMGGARTVMRIFDALKKAEDALFYYLRAIIDTTDEPEAHSRFIELACDRKDWAAAERVTRMSDHYDPVRIRDYIIAAKATDPRPLVNVCDRFDFIPQLVSHLVKTGQRKFVDAFVSRVNPLRCPDVVGALMDLDAATEADVQRMVMSVKNMVPVEPLVAAIESRGRVKMLLPFLEARVADGSTDAPVHTALGKCYVDARGNAKHFLETNQFYDARELGRFCAKREPSLAVIAYSRGQCDDELLAVTNDNSLFREQAAYLVDRGDTALWAKVLEEGNPFRKLVITQVKSTALPSCVRPELVSAAVKAFLVADLPDVLIELLEQLVLATSNTAFSRNANLQNLLILTSIKAAPERVLEYVRRLDNYDGKDIAPACVAAEHYEAAYIIYQKFDQLDEALGVLLDHLKDWNRATDFALRVNDPSVWRRLGVAQLESGVIADGITSLLRGENAWEEHALVVRASRENEEESVLADWKAVLKFCTVARKVLWRKRRTAEGGGTVGGDLARAGVDSELLFALCWLERLTDVESFLGGRQAAEVEDVGDRCMARGDRLRDEAVAASDASTLPQPNSSSRSIWEAARMLYAHVSVWHKLAKVLVRLCRFTEAVAAARHADRVPTWRLVGFACLDHAELAIVRSSAKRAKTGPSSLARGGAVVDSSAAPAAAPAPSAGVLGNVKLLDGDDGTVGGKRARRKATADSSAEKLLRLAHVCCLHLVIDEAELADVVEEYETWGHYAALLDLLEAALTHDRAHAALFTELGVLLARYRPDGLMDHCRLWHGRIRPSRVAVAAEACLLWAEVAYLQTLDKEFDTAARTVMAHSESAYERGMFLDLLGKVGSLEVMHQSIDFVIAQEPTELGPVMSALAVRVDSSRAVRQLRQARPDVLGELGALPLVVPWLLRVQADSNAPDVNRAVNEVFEAEENVDGLRASVENFDDFDARGLAARLETHPLLEMRRIAGRVWGKIGQHERAMELADRDGLDADAISVVAVSKDEELAERIAWRYATGGKRECLTALLYACWGWLSADIAVEVGWSTGCMPWVTPAVIQAVADAGARLTSLTNERVQEREAEEEAEREAREEITDDVSVLLHGLAPQHQPLMLTYHQNGGGFAGGAGFGRAASAGGGGPLMIGWN